MKQAEGAQERGFDRLVARELSRRTRQPLETCPQTEVLAAWFDRSLPDSQAEEIERHLAGCDRCQALAAALARSEPEVIFARPRLEARPWTWHLRWLAPVATAVVIGAVGLTVVVRNNTPAVPGKQVASAALPAAGPSAQLEAPAAAAAPGAPPSLIRPAPPAEAKAGAAEGNASAPALAERGSTAAPQATQPSSALPQGRADKLEVERRADEPARAPARPVEGGQAAALPIPVQTPAAAGQTAAATPLPAPAAPAPANEADAGRPTTMMMRDAAVGRSKAVGGSLRAPATAFAPGGRTGWRLAHPGTILRTDSGGTTWSEQQLPSNAVLTAVSAVSADVCWALGDTILLRTIDGGTWRVVTPPVSGGMASIVALGADAATVRTTSGVTYETADAGATWRRR